MKILVTGAAGNIGIETCRHLRNFENLQIRATDISRSRVSGYLPIEKVDLLKLEDCNRAVENQDAVLHLACPECTLGPAWDGEKHFVMTENLLRASQKNNIKLFVFASSFHAYGLLDHEKASETDICNPISLYGKTKKTCEEIVCSYAENTDMDVLILRYFNVYGQGFDSGLLSLFERSECNGLARLNYDGNVKRDFIHVSDIAEANRLALTAFGLNRKIINIGTGKPTYVKDMKRMVEYHKSNIGNIEFGKNPDPLGSIFADTSLAEKILHFKSRKILEDEIPKLFMGGQ